MHTDTPPNTRDGSASDDVIVDLKASMVLLFFVALVWLLGAVGLLVAHV